MNKAKSISLYETASMLNILLIMSLFVNLIMCSSHAPSSKSNPAEKTPPSGEVLATKSFPLFPKEPTCEQLRAMWIFSKRQSRAAELTNEIPTYRDPFVYNVWSPFYTTLGRNAPRPTLDSLQMVESRHQLNPRVPVFGRILNQEPVIPPHLVTLNNGGKKNKGEKFKIPQINGTKRPTASTSYRYVGGSSVSSPSYNNPNSLAVQGSFHKLKELIWTERAKELTQQRQMEETAARAAVLKEIANGHNVKTSFKQQQLPPHHYSDAMLMDENRSPEMEPNDNERQDVRLKPEQQYRNTNGSSIENNKQIQLDYSGTNPSYVHRPAGRMNHHKFHRIGFGGSTGIGLTTQEFPDQQRKISNPYYLKQYERRKQNSEEFVDNIDGIYPTDLDLGDTESTPRWRNSAGILRKYAKPKSANSHFRERQRAVMQKIPMENKFYQRFTRNFNSKNDDQYIILQDILRQLLKNSNYNNNEFENDLFKTKQNQAGIANIFNLPILDDENGVGETDANTKEKTIIPAEIYMDYMEAETNK